MKILVTGGAGFIGSNLVRYLLQETAHTVVNLDKLTYAGNLESLADLANEPRYHFLQADLLQTNQLHEALKMHQPDAIMHLAAESHVDRSIDGPGTFIQTNVVGTFNLLQTTLAYWKTLTPPQQKAFRLLHVSTDEVYGSLGPQDPAFSETTAYDPHSPYSASKAASDHLCRAWRDTYGLPTLVTHCSNNYGPYQFPEKLIPVVILKCLRGEPIPVYGNGQHRRDWLYVKDHAAALVTVLERGHPGETYAIGGNNEQSNLDLVNTICTILDELIEKKPAGAATHFANHIQFVSDRPGHDKRYAMDTRKIERELAWKPLESPRSGLLKTVRWYLDHPNWWQRILSGQYQLKRLGQPI